MNEKGKKFIELLENDIPIHILRKQVKNDGEVEIFFESEGKVSLSLLIYRDILNIYINEDQLVDDLFITDPNLEYKNFRQILTNKIKKHIWYFKDLNNPQKIIYTIKGKKILDLRKSCSLFRRPKKHVIEYESWINIS